MPESSVHRALSSFDILARIASTINADPLIFLRMATVSRTFYAVFTSDALWSYFDVYDIHEGIYEHFVKTVLIKTTVSSLCKASQRQQSPLHSLGADHSQQLYEQLLYYLNSSNPKGIIEHRKLLRCLAHLNPSLLRFASPDLKDDQVLVHAIVSRRGYALGYVPSKFGDNKRIVLAAISNPGKCERKCSSQMGLYPWHLRTISPRLRKDKDVLRSLALYHHQSVDDELKHLCSSKEFMRQAIRLNKRALEYGSEELRSDKAFVLYAIKNFGHRLESAVPHLRTDPEILEAASSRR